MSNQASIDLLAVGEPSPSVRVSVSDHYALRVVTSITNEFWFLGDQADASKVLAEFPGADIRRAALASLPDFTEDGGFLSGTLSDNPGAYSLADIGHDGSDAFAERFANAQVLKGSLLILYQAGPDENFTEDTRIRTSIGQNMRDEEGELILTFRSIHSLIRGKLFSPMTLKLSSPLTESEDEDSVRIRKTNVTLNNSNITLPRFQHDDSYTTDPGENISYWITPEDEVISTVDEMTSTVDGNTLQFTIRQRGVFGTTISAVDIDEGTSDANLPELVEFPFLEENFSDLLLLVLAGETADGRRAPANQTLNLGLNRVFLPSLEYSGGITDRMHFKGIEEQDARTFIEQRLLGEVFGTLLDNESGQFDFRPRASFASDAASILTLDENNIDLESPLVFEDMIDRLRRFIFIKHGYNSINENYELADIRLSTRTLPGGVFGELEDIDYEFQGWNTAVGTISQLQLRASILQDLHHALLVKTSVDLMPHMNHVRIGDVVTLDLRRVPVVYNSKTREPVALPPFLSMLVVARSGSIGSSNIRVALVASTGTAERDAFDANGATIDPVEYARYAPNALSSVVTPTMNGGREVYSGEHFVEPDQLYRIDNAAILAVDFELKPNRRGQFLGIAHRDELTVLSTNPAINGAGMGVYQGTTDESGSPGYIGNTAADGNTRIESNTFENSSGTAQRGRTNMVSLPAARATRATLNTFTGFSMVNVNGRLVGLPTRLAGSGGQGGGNLSVVHRGTGTLGEKFVLDSLVASQPPRARGGDGGMSAIFMGQKLSWASSAVLADVSGTDGASGVLVANTVTGSGAGGSAGVISILVDGNHTVQTLRAANLRAYNGEPASTFEHATRVEQVRGPVQSWYQGTPKQNRWQSHTAITYLPASDTLNDRPLNAFDQLALDEAGLDGRVVLHLIPDTVNPQFPNNADVNDIAIYEVDARNQDLAIAQTRTYRLTRDNGWVRVEFPDIVAEFKIASFRDRGSTVLWVRETRPPIGIYAIGDSWYHPASRRMYVLGATAADDVLISAESFSDHTGFNLLYDPNWADYASGKDTLSFHQSWDVPLRGEQSGSSNPTQMVPGQTALPYLSVLANNYDFEEDGSVQWNINGDSIVSSGATAAGQARAFYGQPQGFLADDQPRAVWVYARATAGAGPLIIQSAGSTAGGGDPSLQQSVNVSSTQYAWVKFSGLFGAFASQLQVRTTTSGLDVRRLIFTDQTSTDIPLGDAGFGAGSGETLIDRPFWNGPTSDDRNLPLQTSAGRGPFQLLDTGEANSLAWRVDFSGNVPNIIVERFPWKAKPGTQYRATARARIQISSGFGDPNTMGVAVQIEGYDDSNNRVFTTDVQNGDQLDWFSADGTLYLDVVQIVDVPPSISRLSWGAMKVAVRGDAPGYAEIDSCEMVELPYREDTFFSTRINYFGAFDGTSNFTPSVFTFATFDIECKKGMKVTTRVEGFAQTDVNNTEFTPGFRLLGVPSNVDEYGNAVGDVIANPNILTHTCARGGMDAKLGSNVGQIPPFLSTSLTPFADNREFIATTAISRITVRATLTNGASSGASDLILDDVRYSVIYGESFGGDL